MSSRSAKELKCPMCGDVMFLQGRNFYKCRNGCGEFWPLDEDLDMEKLFYQEIRYKKNMVAKWGGSGSSGRRGEVKKVHRFVASPFYL